MTRALALAGLLGVVAWAARPPAAPSLPDQGRWLAQIDAEAAEEEAVTLLAAYLRADTTNPPGNESRGIAVWTPVLDAAGIPWEVHELSPGRGNLVARLTGSGDEAPLCLLSHVDVVSANAEAWSHPPLSGELDDEGYLWGRGALDMKSVGVTQLLSLVWLKRLEVPLRRDVVLLAVADEEVDNQGIGLLAREHWADIGCSHLLNEGGFGARDVLFDDLTVFTVSFAEKGALWLRLVAEGEPGHGSTPLPDSAPVRLMAALDRVRGWQPKPDYHPELHTLLGAVGRKVGGLTGAVLKSPGATRTLATGRLMDHPLSRAILVDTLNVTGFGGADAPNVVPGRVWAQLDVRVLPHHDVNDVLEQIEALVADVPGVHVEVISAANGEASPTDDALYQGLVARLQEAWPDAAVGPFIMPGSTDSATVRPLGVRAYGFGPFVLGEADLRGMHGDNERIHRDNLGRGLRLMTTVVLDAAAAR